MKVLVLISLLMGSFAHAEFPLIDMNNINGDYLDENGRASAEKAFYVLPNVKISHENISIDFNKNDKNLIIRDPSTTVELVFDFSFLSIFKAFAFQNVNIKSDKKLFTVTSDTLDLYIDPKKYHIEEILIQTDVTNIPTSDDDDIDILNGLLLNGKVTAKKMTFKNYNIIIFEEMRAENPEYVSDINKMLAEAGDKLKLPMIVRNMKFNMEEGHFTGKALMDSYINLWLNLAGSVKVNKEQTEIDININKVKLGIFSFKKTLLKLVKNLNLESVTVSGSHIIVDISNKLKTKSKAK